MGCRKITMQSLRMDSPSRTYKPLALSPDPEDELLHRANSCPALVTRRLRELVPLLETVDCVVEEIGPERTVLSLPLLGSAMNQNGTHQAAVFYLVADYAVGVGMFGVLPGCYVTGVHDRCDGTPVQYWLKRGEVKHLAPGTGTLRAEVRITPAGAQGIRNQLHQKGRAEYTGVVSMTQGGKLVAEATHTMGIYVDVPRAAGSRISLFQVQNMKTSALMISGLRDDPISRLVAGDQGRAMANRMAVTTPQLPSLVRARTVDLKRLLDCHGAAFSQVLVLGVGLDPKPCQYSSARQKWFGLDLRDMLQEREARFAAAGAQAANFIPVVGDLVSDSWTTSVLRAGFDPLVATLMVAEGISMYFPRNVLAEVFDRLRLLTSSGDSRLWLDHVSSSLFDMELFEVRSFLSSMTRLGEPFTTGFDDPASVSPSSWALAETTSAAATTGIPEAVHAEYRFSVLKPLG